MASARKTLSNLFQPGWQSIPQLPSNPYLEWFFLVPAKSKKSRSNISGLRMGRRVSTWIWFAPVYIRPPAMADMVDFRKQLDEILEKPSVAAEIAQLAKQHSEDPQAVSLPKPERLISDEDYKQRMQRVEAAADQARKEKLGVWSDSMKEEREALSRP